MLPPVLASAPSYAAVTEARPRLDQTVSAPAAAVVSPEAPAPIAVSTAVAGQLNIMLLSGPERMSQNLATLAEVLGTALKIERRGDENLSDYMGRLVDAIANLSAADRLKLQKLLSQAFAGLQLRTILEAMASPSGPERATLALYLELYRQPDRHAATRSVISSYHELADTNPGADASAARRIPANDAGPTPVNALREQKTGQLAQAFMADGEALLRRLERDTSLSGPNRYANPDAAVSSRPVVPSATLETHSLEDAPDVRAPVLASAGPQPTLSAERSPVEALRMERRSPGSSGASVDGDDVPRVRDPLAATRADDTQPLAQDESELRVAADRPAPSWPAAASVAAEVLLLPVLPPASQAELLDTDFVKALLQLKTLIPEQEGQITSTISRSEVPEEALPPPSLEAMTSNEPSEHAHHAAQLLHPASLHTDEEQGPPGPVLLPEQANVRQAMIRDGLPLPFVSYLIEGDLSFEEVEEEKEKQEQEPGEERDPQEGRGQSAEDSADTEDEETGPVVDREEGPVAAREGPDGLEQPVNATAALPAPAQNPLAVQSEPAHELYLRMAGLT